MPIQTKPTGLSGVHHQGLQCRWSNTEPYLNTVTAHLRPSPKPRFTDRTMLQQNILRDRQQFMLDGVGVRHNTPGVPSAGTGGQPTLPRTVPQYKILRLRSSSLGSTEHHVIFRRLKSWQITIDHFPMPDGRQDVWQSALGQCLSRILIQRNK